MKRNFLRITMAVVAALMLIVTACKKDDAKTDNNTNNNNSSGLPADFLAPTTPMNRVAMLEDFTGVRCGFCPDGQARAKMIADANPGKFVIIATHAGSYAAPASGWMNFTTMWGDALNAYVKPAGYPAGTISRLPSTALGVAYMSGSGTPYALGRGDWSVAASSVMAMSAPVNIGAKATYDAGTKIVTVNVDIYYTADENVANNITVSLLQDHIYAKQSGGTPDPNNYEENHVLRDCMTAVWGDEIGKTALKGSFVRKTFQKMIPDVYNGPGATGGGPAVIDNMSVVVYITRGQMEVLNALQVDIK